jgi:hypothetical protein
MYPEHGNSPNHQDELDKARREIDHLRRNAEQVALLQAEVKERQQRHVSGLLLTVARYRAALEEIAATPNSVTQTDLANAALSQEAA